jgi:sugar phosphate isomerase/epimerase
MTVRADRSNGSGNDLRWAFSTLGCAELSLPEVCELAARFDFPEFEVRALQGRVDLPQYALDHGLMPPRVGSMFENHRVRMIVGSSDFKLISGDGLKRAELSRFCAWADAWRAPYVRVFGGGVWGTPLTATELNIAAENIARWRAEKKAHHWQVELLLETHDAFSASEPCRRLMRLLDEPLGILWDAHHTWRLGGEAPRETWRRLSKWIRHVHVKDSIDKPSAKHPYTYVLPGEGQAPLAEILSLLREQNFQGTVSLEWERLWHPYLPPLPVALAHLREQQWFKAPAIDAAR